MKLKNNNTLHNFTLEYFACSPQQTKHTGNHQATNKANTLKKSDSKNKKDQQQNSDNSDNKVQQCPQDKVHYIESFHKFSREVMELNYPDTISRLIEFHFPLTVMEQSCS